MREQNRLPLALILLTYALLVTLYAAFTPPWQVPDEPAHYNYVRAIAEEGALPVIEPEDYDQAYLEQLASQRFPPDLSIAPLSYEDHQPPFYYFLLLPVYWFFDGTLLPLRLTSALMGGGLLVIAYGFTRTLFPDRPHLAAVVAGGIAFLPQHLAMMAGVENDALAELLTGAALWMAIRYAGSEARGRQYLAGMGLTLGLVVLTKLSAYAVIPVVLLVIALRTRREGGSRPLEIARRWGVVLLTGGLLASPWLARNIGIYGWNDPLALAHHASAVQGQLRTAEAVQMYGWGWLLSRFVRFTFQSFWGQFGWMAVPLPAFIYHSLLLLSGVVGAGFVGWVLDRRRPRLAPEQAWGMLLLVVLTLAAYVGYNTSFVQHQGRYLFPALIPLMVGAALGLDWLLVPARARWAAAALAVAGALLAAGWLFGNLSPIPAGSALGLAAVFGLALLPRWGREAGLVALAGGMVLLDLYSLFYVLLPALG